MSNDSNSALSDDDTRGIADSLRKGAKSQMSSGNTSGVADTAGTALMMSGDPTTMAAGATLKVMSSVADKRRKERQAAADAENNRRSKLITALGNLGQGVGSTGMA